eukprot:10474709-Ditylum_brightwellii.AAC.1
MHAAEVESLKAELQSLKLTHSEEASVLHSKVGKPQARFFETEHMDSECSVLRGDVTADVNCNNVPEDLNIGYIKYPNLKRDKRYIDDGN